MLKSKNLPTLVFTTIDSNYVCFGLAYQGKDNANMLPTKQNTLAGQLDICEWPRMKLLSFQNVLMTEHLVLKKLLFLVIHMEY